MSGGKSWPRIRPGRADGLVFLALVAVAAVILILLDDDGRIHPVTQIKNAAIEYIDGAARIDINAADEVLLQELPGVGEELARRIVEYRAEHGSFATVDDLARVEGIGQGRVEALRPLIAAGKP